MSIADEIRKKQQKRTVTAQEAKPVSVTDSIRQKRYDSYLRQKAEYDEYIQKRTEARMQPSAAKSMTAKEALKQKGELTRSDIEAAKTSIPDMPKKPQKPITEPFLLGDNEKTGGYLVNRFEQGLTGAAYGMQKTQQLINPNMRPQNPYQAQQQQNVSDKMYEARTQTAQAGQSKSKLVQRLGNVAEGIGQQIPNIMLNYASGGAAQFMTAFSAASQAIGNSYESAKRDGADNKQALTYGVAAGLLEGAIEVISGGVPGMKGALDAPIDALTKGVKNRFLKVIAKQGLNALGEGVEEMITETIDPFIKQATYDPNAKFNTKDVLNAGFDGFLTSVFMMAPTTGVELRQTSQINQQAQKFAQNLYTIENQALAAEIIAGGTQQGKAYQMLQEKPVSEMTTDEQVAFIEQVQEELGMKEIDQNPIDANGSGINFTEEQAKDFKPVEQPTTVSEPPKTVNENVSVSEVKKEGGQAQEVEQAEQQTTPQAEQDIKSKQFEIISKANPAPDDTHTWIRNKDDIKTYRESLDEDGYESDTDLTPDYTGDTVSKALETGRIVVYSSYPVKPGVFVTPSKMEAQNYAGKGKVYSQEIALSDVAWIDAIEGQYAPTSQAKSSQPTPQPQQANTQVESKVSEQTTATENAIPDNVQELETLIKGLEAQKKSGVKINENRLIAAKLKLGTIKEQRRNEKFKPISVLPDSKPTLPDTEQELSALVNKMEEDKKQGIEIDLQLFAEAKDKLKKISELRTNTLERTQKLTDKEREMLDPALFGYDPEKVDEWRSEAEFSVENAYELTKKRIESATAINGGVQAYEAALITQKMLEKARQTGDYAELKDWLPKVAEKTREAARALTATRYAYNPKSPAAAIVEVQRAVDNVNKEIADSEPQIKTDKKKIKDGVKKAQREAGEKVVKDIETLSPEELLARRIQAHLNEATDAEIDPIKDMVNELYRIAQESPLPDNKTASKRDPMEFVVQAVKNRGQYAEVFDKAKEIVQEKFKDNPEALELLEAYFAKEAVPVISKIRLNTAVKNVIKNMGTTIEQIAKSGRRTKTEIFKALATEFITKGKLEQGEAQYLVPFLVDAYDAQVKERAQQILGNMLKTPTKTKGVPFTDRIKEIINMGVANEDAMNRVLADKYNLPKLDDQTIQDILDIYDTVDTGKIDEIKNAIIKESGFTGKQADQLREKLGNLAIDEYKAIAMAQVMKRFSDRQKTTFWRKLSAVQAMGHLLNAVTPMRNVLSNTAMAQLEKVSETIASAIFKGDTKAGLKYSKDARQKAAHEMKRADIDIDLGIDSRRENRGKYELFRGATFKKGTLSAAEKLMSKTLRLPDVYFYELRKQDAIERLTALNGGYLTDDIRTQAEQEAAYATFMDDSMPAKVLEGLKSVANIVGFGKRTGKFHSAEFGLGDLIIKYARVPGNIMARTLEYSPLGYAKFLFNMYQAKRGSGNSPMMQRQAALAFGRATTGTGLMAMGYILSALGLFVQRKPDEKDGEAALSRAMGLNQGQVNISALGRAITGGSTKPKDGDFLVSISFFEPFATMLVSGASIRQAMGEGKSTGETITLVAGNTAEEILDMPTMAIIQAIYQEAMREGANPLTVAAVPLVKAIPGFVLQPVRSVAKAVDPVTRSTTGKNAFEKSGKETMRNIPLLSTLLEPQVDPTGEEYKNLAGEPATSLLNYLLNPGYATIYKDIPYKDKLRKLSQSFPDVNIWPRYYAVDSVDDKKLTDEEKTVYMKAFGQYYNREFERMLKYTNVNKLSKSGKQDLIEQLEAARKDALAAGREAVTNRRKKKK